jgi:hypothetical protein
MLPCGLIDKAIDVDRTLCAVNVQFKASVLFLCDNIKRKYEKQAGRKQSSEIH